VTPARAAKTRDARGEIRGARRHRAVSRCGTRCAIGLRRDARGTAAATPRNAEAPMNKLSLSFSGRARLALLAGAFPLAMAACGGGTATSGAYVPSAVNSEAAQALVMGSDSGNWDVACAVLSGDRVRCFSVGAGYVPVDPSAEPSLGGAGNTATGLHDVRGLAILGSHECAVLADHTVHCWAEDTSVDAPPAIATDAVQLAGAPPLLSYESGNPQLCARTTAGQVRCWSPQNDSSGATTLDLQGQTAVDIAGNANGLCVARSDGAVRCWYDQLTGAGDAVPGLTGAQQLALGDEHGCALVADGTVHCWGANELGQLGTRTPASDPASLPVPGLDHVEQISAGGVHTCARVAGGQLRCWGDNAPLVDHDGRTAPPQVPGIDHIASVASGQWQDCALDTASTVRCW
jgi:hypothetical protein